MERRTPTSNVARRVADAIDAAGMTPESLAQATDIPLPVLRSRISSETPFTLAELVKVGGLFSLPLDWFFREKVAA